MQIINAQITLLVNGEEKTFSEEELVAILEKHFFDTTTEQKIHNPISGPKEGELFEINTIDIDRSLFREQRKDINQEKMRQTILKALSVAKTYTEMYCKTFWTLWPVKAWKRKNSFELDKLAFNLGGHIANWVEQSLEWAQRIRNGESLEKICNDADTANWYRLVRWRHDCYLRVGGAGMSDNGYPAYHVDFNYLHPYADLDDTVPLVVLRHK